MINRFIKKLPQSIFLLSITYCLLLTVLSGCTVDTRFASEKLFWQAKQKAAKIMQNTALDDKDYRGIIAAYREVADAYPLESITAKVQFIITDMYLMQGKYAEAQGELENIIQNFFSQKETASRAQFMIGRIYETQEKWKQAFEEYDKIIDLYSLTPLGLKMPIYIVKHYQDTGESEKEERAFKKAVRGYNRLIEKYEETPAAFNVRSYLASLYLGRKDFKEAVSAWDTIILNYPHSAQAVNAFLSKGEMYVRILKDAPKAIEVYKEFIIKYPKNKILGEVKVKLAQLYLKNSQIEKAKDIFSAMIKEYLKDQDLSLKAYVGLSYCYRKEEDTDRVIEIYGKIKESYPDSKAALGVPFLIAQYYDELRYDSRADKAYKTAISEYEGMLQESKGKKRVEKEAANFLVLCYVKKKEIDKAFHFFRMLADKYPEDPAYLLDLAALYSRLNAADKAIGVYKELIDKYPDNKFLVKLGKSQIKTLKNSLQQ